MRSGPKVRLDMAEFYDGSSPTEPQRAAAASNAVAGGIAAADAACCWALGQQNVGGHEGAVPLLRSVRDSSNAAAALRRLIDMKNQVQYLGKASTADLQKAQRATRIILAFAEGLVE